MQFSVREWRKSYDFIHELGALLRDSRPTYDENEDYVESKIELSRDEQDLLETNINAAIQRVQKYLDRTGVKMPRPLWYFDRKNPETHMSAPEFKYGHLLK